MPWYNVHKICAVLRDAWLYAGNEEAKKIFLKFCDWGINITSDLSDQFWRDANDGGYFSYSMSTNKDTSLALVVRFRGAEWGSRKFDIYIDDEKLVDNTGRWNR